MSVILSIEEAKAKGLTKLVEQLERDKERREVLKMKPLEDVKIKMEVEDIRRDIRELEDLFQSGPPFRLNWTHNPLHNHSKIEYNGTINDKRGVKMFNSLKNSSKDVVKALKETAKLAAKLKKLKNARVFKDVVKEYK